MFSINLQPHPNPPQTPLPHRPPVSPRPTRPSRCPVHYRGPGRKGRQGRGPLLLDEVDVEGVGVEPQRTRQGRQAEDSVRTEYLDGVVAAVEAVVLVPRGVLF